MGAKPAARALARALRSGALPGPAPASSVRSARAVRPYSSSGSSSTGAPAASGGGEAAAAAAAVPHAESHEAHHDAGHGDESPYDPPGGWLWGVPPGEKYQNEGWENAMKWGFGGCAVLAVVGYAFKPDTRSVRAEGWFLCVCRRAAENGQRREADAASGSLARGAVVFCTDR